LRSESNDEVIKSVLKQTISHKEKNGLIAEKNRLKNKNIIESMSTIGG